MPKEDISSNSFIYKLKEEKKINNEFLNTLSHLSLEEVLSLKLEQTIKSVGGKWFGFPMRHILHQIVSEALINVSLSMFHSDTARSAFCGMNNYSYYLFKKKILDRQEQIKEMIESKKDP